MVFNLLIILCVGLILILLLPTKNSDYLSFVSLSFSCLAFVYSIIIVAKFDIASGEFQFVTTTGFKWVTGHVLSFGLSPVSLFFVILITFAAACFILLGWIYLGQKHTKTFLAFIFVLEILLILATTALILL